MTLRRFVAAAVIALLALVPPVAAAIGEPYYVTLFTRILILACEHCAASGHGPNAVDLPCIAMAPPSLIDYVISRNLADGVVAAGCAERACYHRLGVSWTKGRFAGERDPYLRARVPRARLATIWASPTEQRRFAGDLARFTAAVAALPPHRSGEIARHAPSTGRAAAAGTAEQVVP